MGFKMSHDVNTHQCHSTVPNAPRGCGFTGTWPAIWPGWGWATGPAGGKTPGATPLDIGGAVVPWGPYTVGATGPDPLALTQMWSALRGYNSPTSAPKTDGTWRSSRRRRRWRRKQSVRCRKIKTDKKVPKKNKEILNAQHEAKRKPEDSRERRRMRRCTSSCSPALCWSDSGQVCVAPAAKHTAPVSPTWLYGP